MGSSTRGGIITGFLITMLLGTIAVAETVFFWGGRIIFPESGYNLDNFINLVGIPTLVVLCHANVPETSNVLPGMNEKESVLPNTPGRCYCLFSYDSANLRYTPRL